MFFAEESGTVSIVKKSPKIVANSYELQIFGATFGTWKKKNKKKTVYSHGCHSIAEDSRGDSTAVKQRQELQGAAFARRRFSSGDGRETLPKSGDVASLPRAKDIRYRTIILEVPPPQKKL